MNKKLGWLYKWGMNYTFRSTLIYLMGGYTTPEWDFTVKSASITSYASSLNFLTSAIPSYMALDSLVIIYSTVTNITDFM